MFDLIYSEYLDELEYVPVDNIVVEVWCFGNDDPIFEARVLPEEEIIDWLAKGPPEPTAQPLHGGLRLIICHPRQPRDVGLRKLPFTRPTFEAIIRSFRLPRTYPKALYYESAHFTKFSTGDLGSRSSHIALLLRTLNYDSARYGLAVTYETESNISQGLIHGPSEGAEFNRLLANIKEMASQAVHPMLMPILAADVATMLSEIGIDGCDHVMMKLEYETGQHPYFQDQKDPLDIDFVPVTRKLNSNSTEVGILEMRVESLLLLFDDLDKAIRDFQESVPMAYAFRFTEDSHLLKEHIQYLRSANANLLLRVHHIQRKAQTQLAVVYNFIAQRDNRLNIDVARDSKAIAAASRRDSSSMKTIAVLTIAFLPGTYISSLFAMPLFDWQARRGESVFLARFWIYWAITIPLTAIVIFIWFVWIKRKTARHAQEDRAAGISDHDLLGNKEKQETKTDSDTRHWWLNSFATGSKNEGLDQGQNVQLRNTPAVSVGV